MPNTYHEVLKHMAAIALSRLGYRCTLEDRGEQDRELNPMRPDVSARLKVKGGRQQRWPVVYVEVQSPPITKEWLDKIRKNYDGKHVIIIDLGKLERSAYHVIGVLPSVVIWRIYNILEQQIENETLMPEREIKHIDRKGYKRRKAEAAAIEEMSM
jgi:hypothetical protein